VNEMNSWQNLQQTYLFLTSFWLQELFKTTNRKYRRLQIISSSKVSSSFYYQM